MDQEYLSIGPEANVAEAKRLIRGSGLDYHGISYVYVQDASGLVLGVVDARAILLAPNTATMESLMTSPVVSAEVDDMREDLAAMFRKYHFHMLPVVDAGDRIQGVVRYSDIMKPSVKA